MPKPQHNVIGMKVDFDFVKNRFIFNVRMRNKLSAEVVQRRAQERGLNNPDNHVQASVRGSMRGVQITLSGPTLDDICNKLLFAPGRKELMRGLTLPRVDTYIEAHNRQATPATELRFNGTDLSNIVASLCA